MNRIVYVLEEYDAREKVWKPYTVEMNALSAYKRLDGFGFRNLFRVVEYTPKEDSNADTR